MTGDNGQSEERGGFADRKNKVVRGRLWGSMYSSKKERKKLHNFIKHGGGTGPQKKRGSAGGHPKRVGDEKR